MSQSPGRDGPLLQLQKVDSSQAGAQELSPVFRAPAPTLPTMESHPICIPLPYTEQGRDFGTLPFYSSSLVRYGGPPIADNPPRQSLSPTHFWTPPTHHGHVSPMTVHQPQSRLQHGQPNNGAWSEPAEEKRKPVVGKRGLSEDRGVADGKADMHFCAVCSDYASGYHYGVWSCEGCKAFFKRSIQGHNAYICPATNQCTIDKNRRRSCQACRLRKCYEVGMMKSGMRRDRSSGPQRRVSHLRPRASASTQRQGVEVAEEDRALHQMATAAAAATTAAGGHHRSDGSLTPEQLIARILDAEPPEIYLMKDVKRPFTEAIIMMSLTNLADKELVQMISWAKKVPGFVDLGLLEQVHLLECCWLEVLMLGLMWRSVDQPGKLMFSPDLILTRDDSSCVQGFMEIFDMLLAATARFRELRLQKEEYVCLKAMILLNSNMPLSTSEGGEGNEFQSRSKLLQLLDAVTDALVWAIAKGGGSFQQQSTRMAHLLMLLSHIRHLSNKGMDHLHSMKMKKMVPVYELLLEMLDAHVMHSSRLAIPVAQEGPAPQQQQQQLPRDSPRAPQTALSCPRTLWPQPEGQAYWEPLEFGRSKT